MIIGFLFLVGFQNGQLLTRISATVEGFCNSRLVFDYEEVPDPLVSRDINVSRQMAW